MNARDVHMHYCPVEVGGSATFSSFLSPSLTSGLVLVSWGDCKYHRLGGFDDRNSFFQLGRLEVQDQGDGGADFSRERPPWPADDHLLPVCPGGLASVCICVLISSYKDTGQTGPGPPTYPHLT